MSRGLGKLQREILDSLEASRDLPRYHGGRNLKEPSLGSGPVVQYHGTLLPLREGVYDLRAVKRAVAYADHAHRCYGADDYMGNAFSVAFHRAARALVRRGLLVPTYNDSRQYPKPQLRFVHRPKC
jgi:hypothetical protein